MRDNENLKIIGDKVVLVPYESEHVPKYHDWMEDEEIRRLTASERLSLDEEFAMQKSWREDLDKCTFIVLLQNLLKEGKSEIESMVGDVNIFIDREEKSAECEVMIAEKTARGQGVAKEAVSLLISYASIHLGLQKFFVRISDDNVISIGMFEKLGFCKVSYSTAFKEHTLELPEGKMDKFKELLTTEKMQNYRK